MRRRTSPAGFRGIPTAALVVAVAFAGSSAGQALPPEPPDDAVFARNILPPGQGRHPNMVEVAPALAGVAQPPHNADQIDLYEDLVGAAPGLQASDLDGLFKSASLAPEGETRVYSPKRPGTTIVRDDFDVPHVFGAGRADVFYGAGYVSGEDRLFMMDVLRHLGRGRLSEFLGASPANLQSDCAQFRGADYTDGELMAMANRVANDLDPVLGAIVRGDLEAFVQGVNDFISEAIADPTKLPAEYPALQVLPRTWTITDTVAVSSLIGATFSPGGGGQVANARFLEALAAEGFSAAEARSIFDDFHFADDPEAPHTTDDPFPFLTNLGTPDPAAVVVPDDPDAVLAQLNRCTMPPQIDGPMGPIALLSETEASNALLVAKTHSASGNAIAVIGPQVGYFSPEILMEIGLHGPGVNARGATFPGVSLYVLLGRGKNYAWSATTANGDHIDIRAVELCDPDGGDATLESEHYLADGHCVPMETRSETFLAKPSAGGQPTSAARLQGDPGGEASAVAEERIVVSRKTERTRHGIVQARGFARSGKPFAFVRQRSSYRKEVDAALTFLSIHDPARVQSIDDLRSAFVDRFSYSFNWFLVHEDDVAFQLTGHYPVLPEGVDPDLPIHGDSRWDPTGLLPKAQIPNVVNPARGFITNWNNKQAPGFRAADQMFAFGPTQRVQLLTDGVVAALANDPAFDDGSADGKVSLVELAKAMAIAATQDLYGAKILPLLLEVLRSEPISDPRVAELVGLLDSWTGGGAHRRDLGGDGQYEEQGAIALFDAWWTRAVRAAFEPVLGGAFGTVPLGVTTPANPGGSAYFGGWHGQMDKDLRAVLGRPSSVSPFTRIYCGGTKTADGTLPSCRAALLASLEEADDALTAKFESGNPDEWDVDEPREQIAFSAVGLLGQRRMHWQNRPTFQQVLEFGPNPP